MEGRTAVHLAVAQQNEPAVKALLLNDKCDLSVQDNVKRSPLHWAAVLGLIYFCINITIEFMFAGINMFWARLRLILARAVNITLEGIEKIKTEKNDNKTL